MGNKSCCFGSDSPIVNNRNYNTKRSELYHHHPHHHLPAEPPLIREDSFNNLQHISEREPDDAESDPSNHPCTSTLFLTRSLTDPVGSDLLKRRSHHGGSTPCSNNSSNRLSKKFSSCSTIFIDDSTVSQPNLKSTIKCVALAIYYHIKNRETDSRFIEIFDEKTFPLTKDPMPTDSDKIDPEHRHVYRFIRTLFSAAQLTAECAIITLVYIERLLHYAELGIMPSNWKRIVLGAILLSSKVWDDQAVWNIDYCQILRDITVEDMNELERQFLELLQFNINVTSSVYAKYYFDLRALADANDLSFPAEPLSKDRAEKLEATSRVCEDKLKELIKCSIKRSSSMDGMSKRRSQVILS